MTSTHSANPPNFPEDAHFDGTNYISFKNRVLIAARARGARGHLEGTTKRPTTPTHKSEPSPTDSTPETAAVAQTDAKATEWLSSTPSVEEWDERDAWALGLII
ncbi:hypothetical protein H0H87_010147 [Tephrocybe sp. NHM501043]|nr:hypothetical protein H0H87_010147 [Tephrocybe sp. NHM501043]